MMAAVLREAEITVISLKGTGFVRSLHPLQSVPAPVALWAAGPTSILNRESSAFFCSAQCPGSVILQTFDAITAMRDEGRTLIGGFHSPMEWECLRILLRGKQPVIWAPARSILGMRLKPELRPAFEAGRLLILSPFEAKHKRITAALSEERNRFVGALARELFIPHAAPNSQTLALAKEQAAWGKPITTIADPSNAPLFELGAHSYLP